MYVLLTQYVSWCTVDSSSGLLQVTNMLTLMATEPHSLPLPALNMAETHKSTAGQTSDQSDFTLTCCDLGLQLKVNVPGTHKALSFPSAHTKTKTYLCAHVSSISVGVIRHLNK